MNQLTESQIEQTIDEAFSKIMYNQEDIASQFANNYERYEEALKELLLNSWKCNFTYFIF